MPGLQANMYAGSVLWVDSNNSQQFQWVAFTGSTLPELIINQSASIQANGQQQTVSFKIVPPSANLTLTDFYMICNAHAPDMS